MFLKEVYPPHPPKKPNNLKKTLISSEEKFFKFILVSYKRCLRCFGSGSGRPARHTEKEKNIVVWDFLSGLEAWKLFQELRSPC
jgi:hypothetical protein